MKPITGEQKKQVQKELKAIRNKDRNLILASLRSYNKKKKLDMGK